MYSDGIILRNNTIINASGPTGVGIGFKETSDVDISGNKVLSCAIGIYLDLSPYQPGTTNRFPITLSPSTGWPSAGCPTGDGNVFIGNRFEGNITQVVLDGGRARAPASTPGKATTGTTTRASTATATASATPPMSNIPMPTASGWTCRRPSSSRGRPCWRCIDFLERLAPLSEPEPTGPG